MAMIDNLEAMLARGQDNALLRYGLGGEYLKAKNYTKAIEHLKKCIALDRKYSAAWKLLGEALAESGDKVGAIEIYKEGIQVAEEKGDKQAAKEMTVFLKRLQK